MAARPASPVAKIDSQEVNSHYDGPQPPAGHGVHHYHFRVFALDVPKLDVSNDCAAEDVLEAAQAHTLAEGEMVGLFAR